MPETKTKKRDTLIDEIGMNPPQATEEQAVQETQAPPKKVTGRPTKYNPALMDGILARIADGEPLRKICREEGMPAWRTIYLWLEQDEALSARFARARDMGGDAIFEDTLLIADNPHYGTKSTESDKGAYVTTEDMLGHRKLQIETRFKLLSKWNPKKYGDRQIIAGDAENPLEVKQQSDMLDAVLLNLQLTRQSK